MSKSFRSLIEDIESVVSGSKAPARSVEPSASWDDIVMEGVDDDGDWTPATSKLMIATIIENLVYELEVSEEDAMEFVSAWLAEAYKWSYDVQPDEKDVTPDIGTVDEPSHGVPKRGFRGRASGLTPTADEGMRVILNTLSRKPPKPINEFPVETAAEMWKDALGKALNKGIGVKWELDKPTGINYPMPDYSVIYGIWKEMMAKTVGVRPSREGEVKLKHALDGAAKEAAKDLRKGIEALGGGRGAQASAILRGRKGKKNPFKSK